MGKRRKRWLVVGLAALALITVLAVRVVWFPGRAFDSAAWQDEALVQEGVRLEMTDRLLARGTLVGKTRAEAVELLGEPSPTRKFADWDLVYWLGAERGFISIDSEWLVLRFGADGLVEEGRIVRD